MSNRLTRLGALLVAVLFACSGCVSFSGPRDLQAQLEGTENRISVERKKFDESVQSYNTYIRKFPNTIIANMSGFEQKRYFEATAGAETAPVVTF